MRGRVRESNPNRDPFSRQSLGDGQSDAAAGAGDNRAFAGERLCANSHK